MKREKLILLLLVFILAITFLPWLGDTLFNTKGEPREALVAVSMINSGNYILPESYGADIPYKPPFLAWLIAAFSFLTGGVNEVSSRLPSVIATMAMIVYGFIFYRKYSGSTARAFAMALVTITTVEVFRAATACRVDMVLTACVVMAIFAMVSASDKKNAPALSWAGIALMTCAVLTKGPVGMLLPCLVTGIYLLIHGHKFGRTFGVMVLSGVLALIVPALWYYAAWREGGERFLNLAIEENFGRFTGSMSYDSHVNPWWYNIITVVAGMAPYTLLALLSLFSLKHITAPKRRKPREIPFRVLAWLRDLRPETLLAVVATVVIFLFYCFPASKRSVYLLPIYPFLSWFIVALGKWLITNHKKTLSVYSSVIAIVGVLIGWLVWGLHYVDATVIPGIKNEIADLAGGLYSENMGIVDLILVNICILGSLVTLYYVWRRNFVRQACGTLVSTLAIYWVLGATILPVILNPKSDIVIAREVLKSDPQVAHTYTFNDVKMLRYYTAAFYLNDRLRLFAPEENSSQSVAEAAKPLPTEGFLIVNTLEMPMWQTRYGSAYRTDTVWMGTRRSSDCRAIPMIIKFKRKS